MTSATVPAGHPPRILGEVVTAFSAVEFMAQLTLAGFVADRDVGYVVAADLNFSAVVTKLKALSSLPGLGPVGDELYKWTSDAQQASERRNHVVHSMWGTVPNKPHERGNRIKLSARGKNVNVGDILRQVPGTIQELVELLTELARITTRGRELSHELKATGKWYGYALADTPSPWGKQVESTTTKPDENPLSSDTP